MTFEQYRKLCLRTAGTYSPNEKERWTMISVLGLCGEAGEVADYLKKVYGHNHQLDETKLKKELGDVLWYLADICSKFGFSLNEVAEMNIEKLKARYPAGFDPKMSVNRKVGDV